MQKKTVQLKIFPQKSVKKVLLTGLTSVRKRVAQGRNVDINSSNQNKPLLNIGLVWSTECVPTLGLMLWNEEGNSDSQQWPFSFLTNTCTTSGWRGCLTLRSWVHIKKVTHKVLKPCGISGESSYHRSYRQHQPLWRPCFHVCHHTAHAWMLLLSATFCVRFFNENLLHLLFVIWLLVWFYFRFMAFIQLCVEIRLLGFSCLCPPLHESFLIISHIIPPRPSHGRLYRAPGSWWLGFSRSVASELWGSKSLLPHYKTLGKVHPEWQQVGHFIQRKACTRPRLMEV